MFLTQCSSWIFLPAILFLFVPIAWFVFAVVNAAARSDLGYLIFDKPGAGISDVFALVCNINGNVLT